VRTHAYDAEGNRTAKFVDTNPGGTLSLGDTDVTLYAYDQRNRLVAVSHVNAWTATQAAGLTAFNATGTSLPGSDLELRYSYDYADRRIRKSLDTDGQAGIGAESVSFAAYAGNTRTLEIARPNDKIVIDSVRGPIGFLGQVVQRNFYGNGVDEILAVDRVNWNGTTPTTSTFWTFTDHQDSVRDIVSGNAGSLGQVVEHRQYDSFGKVVRRTIGPQAGAATTAGVGVEFAYAGRPVEARTGLSDNRARWYEPATGRFINEDPSGFKGGDANLFRYVGNDPLNQVDPSGLAAKWASGAKASVPAAGYALLARPEAFTPQIITPSTVTAAAYASLGRQPAAVTTPLSIAPPVVTVSTSGGTVYSPMLAVQRPAGLAFTPYANLVTTGRASVPPVPEARWTLQDREAALRADMAYKATDGGMLKNLGIGYNLGNPNNSFTRAGMSATLTRSPVTGTYYLAFRGTEIRPVDQRDVYADVAQASGNRTPQYEQAILLTQLVQQRLGPGATLHLAGHSLGGGLAAAASYATGLDATVFNPASLNRVYSKGTPGAIRSHVVVGDLLSVGRTVQNLAFALPTWTADEKLSETVLPPLLTAPGKVILHPPRSLNTHQMNNFPPYR
jgi:RHS repeat-associated protein